MNSLCVRFLALFLALLGGGATAYGQKIVIKGSDTLGAKLIPVLAEEFKARYPGVSFEIAAEGSSTGIAAILSASADIGMSSRETMPTELSAAAAKGIEMRQYIIAYDGLAVILNDQNPINSLRRRRVERIFAGDINDWSAVGGEPGPISIYTRNSSSGTFSDFKAFAMSKRDYAESSQKMAGNEQIVAEVASNPNGIGYVGLAYAKTPGVKTVAIDRRLPETESVHSGEYPYARPTFFYTNGAPTEIVREFIAFTLSPEGQAIVERVGFVPLRR